MDARGSQDQTRGETTDKDKDESTQKSHLFTFTDRAAT